MILQIFAGDRLLENSPLDQERLNDPLYILGLKKQLEEKYIKVFAASNAKPVYYLQQKEVAQKRKSSFD